MINVKYGVHMTFEKYPIVAILVILFVIIGLAFVLVSSLEFSKGVKKAKMDEINKIVQSELDINEKVKKKQEVEIIENSVFASGISKIILFISIAVPVVSLIIRIVTEFR